MTDMPTVAPEDLFQRWNRDHDRGALEELLALALPRAWAQAQRQLGAGPDAEDAVQEALLQLVRTAARFDGSVPFPAWLGRLVQVACSTVRRASLRRRRREALAMATSTSAEPADDGHDAEAVRAAVESLPASSRATIELHYFAGLSQADAASALGITENAFAVRIHRARERLRDLLAARGVGVGAAGVAAMLALPAQAAVPPALTVGATQLAAQAASGATLPVTLVAGSGSAALVKPVLLAACGLTALAGGVLALAPGGDSRPFAADRAPVRPAWEVDITHGLERLPRDCADAATAIAAKGVPIAEALSRQAREADPRPTGFDDWWRVTAAVPGQAAGWPVALDIDEGRTIQGLWSGSEALKPRRMTGSFADGQRSALLPALDGARSVTLVAKVRTLTHLYANGTGQWRLRPAQLVELIQLAEPKDGRTVAVRNQGPQALEIGWHVRHEDYFGAELGRRDGTMQVNPAEERSVDLVPPADRAWYKTRMWMDSGPQATPDHWYFPDDDRLYRNRDDWLRLDRGWEFVSGDAEPVDFHPPAQGWRAVKLPHQVKSPQYRTPWAWYRCQVTVPGDWQGGRALFHLPSVQFRAAIFCNGKPVATRHLWELPDSIPVPVDAKPGTVLQFHLALTDHRVGVVPGTKLPDLPDISIPGNTRNAPIPDGGLGLNAVPELLGCGMVRTDFCAITTPCMPGTTGTHLATALELANDAPAPIAVRIQATIHRCGREVLALPPSAVTLPVGKCTQKLTIAWPTAERWTPENPVLYELRLVIRDTNGKILDQIRERFGVRSFGIAGDRFTLNGNPIFLLGGSHVMLSTSTWPIQPHPYRLYRHYPNVSRNGFMTGSACLNLADEMGAFIKAEDHNCWALHLNRYDWTRPELWERMFSSVRAQYRAWVNRPGTVIWDIGNELRYDRHGDQMGALYKRVRELDPTRPVTNSGPYPQATGAEILDFHGWGSWDSRDDYWYYHPEARPSYLKDQFMANRRPAGEGAEHWRAWTTTGPPGYFDRVTDPRFQGLTHQEGRPVLFSEGHYYEDVLPPELTGLDAWRPLPTPEKDAWNYGQAQHFLNYLACRRWSVQNVRLADVPSSILHVDRGIGRWIQSLAVLSEDRNTRVWAGERWTTRFVVINDLTAPARTHVSWRLMDGDACVAEQRADLDLAPGSRRRVPLDMAIPSCPQDRGLRLQVSCWAEGRTGFFRDDIPVTVYARTPLVVPAGIKLWIFDPVGGTGKLLVGTGIPCKPITKPSQWSGGENEALLIGSDALAGIDSLELRHLRDRIAAGARVVILDHRELPVVLSQRLVQRAGRSNSCGRLEPSPLTRGLLAEDLRHWQTRENDWVVVHDPIDIPATGNARAHLMSANGSTPLLEVRESDGAVVFCQLNLRDALGVEPAARQVLANLLAWFGAAPPFPGTPTLIVGSDGRFAATLRGRVGVNGTVAAQPTAAQIASSRLIVLPGTHAPSRQALDPEAVRRCLDAGGTLLCLDLDQAGAAWLAELVHRSIAISDAPAIGAYRTRFTPLLAGTTHGDLWWSTLRNLDLDKPLPPSADLPAHRRLEGRDVETFTAPALVGSVPVGRGRVVISTIRHLENPIPQAMRVLSAILTGCGARLEVDGIIDLPWSSEPVDLAPQAHAPRRQDQCDLSRLPTGRQRLADVTWQLGDKMVAAGGTAPAQVTGIAVGRKAERLWFLHTARGAPQGFYRVTYLEDRRAWIPGKPDPFVLVTVRNGAQVLAAEMAMAVLRGDRFLGDAACVWSDSATGQGIYATAWDNPHPDKTIESVDVVVNGGNGSLILVGLATANRGQPVDAPSLATVAPGIKADRVAARITGANYGAVILKNGTVPVIHDREGRPLLALPGWENGNQQQRGTKAIVSEEPGPSSGTRVFVIDGGTDGMLVWRARLEFAPARIHAAYTYRWATADGPHPHTTVAIRRLGNAPWKGAVPNALPALLPIATGTAVVSFDRSFIGWYMNHVVSEYGLSLYMKPEYGQERTAWFDITMP